MDWSGVDYLWCFYQLFGLSFWRHPFTAEHPLLRHWCRDTFLQTWWRNKLILILEGLRVSEFSANVHFWVNCIVFMDHFHFYFKNLAEKVKISNVSAGFTGLCVYIMYSCWVSHAHLDIPPHSSGNHGNSCTGRIQVCFCSWHGNRKAPGRPGDTHQHLKNEKSTFNKIMYYQLLFIILQHFSDLRL